MLAFNAIRLSIVKSRQYLINYFKSEKPFKSKKSFLIEEILRSLKKDGIYIMENFIPNNLCLRMCDEIDITLNKYPEIVKGDKFGCDKRIFGAENISKNFYDYFDNKFINNLAEFYLKSKIVNISTMANKVEYKVDNMGSASGAWHRDNVNKQFKTILYLSDVKINGGAFQYIKKTHKFFNFIYASKLMQNDILANDFTEEQIDNFCKKKGMKIETAEYQAGTLIILDTSILHRGSPIGKNSNPRYAITNYIYQSYMKDIYFDHLDKSLKKENLN